MASRDLRAVVDGILFRWGHEILVQRRVNEYTSDTPEFDPNLERHTVRHMYPANRALPGVADERLEGVIHDSELIYYFRWDANPGEGDRLYENIDVYPNNLSTYLIDTVLPMRFERGRIEYWVAGVSRETPS